MPQFRIPEDETLALLQGLIAIDSVNPSLVPGGAGEAAIAKHVGAVMTALGLTDVQYQDVGGGRLNVVGVLRGTGGGRTLMLNGHTDIVSTAGMTHDPFSAEVSEDRVYGRGAFDMKGGLAAMLMAVAAVIRSGARPRGDVIVACVADEEYASLGTEAVVRAFHADGGIVCEPTGGDLCIAHKGFAWATVRCHGRAAHGSDYQNGVDAIFKAGALLAEMARYDREELRARSHPLLGSPSLHASLINGGRELSTYPAECVIQLERRTLPGETRADIIAELSAILARLSAADPEFSSDFEVTFFRDALEVAPDAPIATLVSDAATAVSGRRPEVYGAFGWLDSALMAAAGIPTVIFGADGGGAHSATEWADLSSVVATAAVLAEVIVRFCNG